MVEQTCPVFQFNFVGKLLGPRGSSLKRLQERTRTRYLVTPYLSHFDEKNAFELNWSNHKMNGNLLSKPKEEILTIRTVFLWPLLGIMCIFYIIPKRFPETHHLEGLGKSRWQMGWILNTSQVFGGVRTFY